MRPEFVYIAAAIVGVFSAGRFTRLVVADEYPPTIWVRMKWDTITHDGPWSKFAHCHWCFAPWAFLPILLWGYFTDLQPAWWLFNGWLAGSYLASIVVNWDEG